MKTLEIIITILICFAILLFVQKQSEKIQQKESYEEKFLEQINKHYKHGQLQL